MLAVVAGQTTDRLVRKVVLAEPVAVVTGIMVLLGVFLEPQTVVAVAVAVGRIRLRAVVVLVL
jgi:hypothetical protein